MFSEGKFMVQMLYNYVKFLTERRLIGRTINDKEAHPKECKLKTNQNSQQLVMCLRTIVTYVKFILEEQLTALWPPRDGPIVRVKQGAVRGATGTLPNGRPYHYFKGIPYAEAPIGKLRFQPPVPLQSFAQPVLDCYVDRDEFIQQAVFISVLRGSETQLHLSVYTPSLPTGYAVEENPKKLPVMVWIHGGGFNTGTVKCFLYDPAYFLEQGVLFVAMTYRLGALGFLSIPSMGIEGNAGLKDQALAFRWVYENISQFGGDPENITIFGESAGSMSAYLHYLSPNSRKYFQRVICQSGVTCSETFFQSNASEEARKLAMSLGCKGDSDEEVLDTLLKAPACQLTGQQNSGRANARSTDLVLKLCFRPVIERFETTDSIITKPPVEILQDYNTLRMPFMNGCTSREGILSTTMMGQHWDRLNHEPSWFVPKFMNNLRVKDRSELGRKIQKFYFGDRRIDMSVVQEMCDYKSDTTFLIDSIVNAEWMAKHQPQVRHFHYRFSYNGRYNFGKLCLNLGHLEGASHTDELFYMYKSGFLPKLEEKCDEVTVRQNMIKLWTNFAKFGDPTPDEDDSISFKWLPIKSSKRTAGNFNLDCLEIGLQPRMVRNPCNERLNFWRRTLKQHCETMLR
ncbi:esterase B1-like [Sabethes cyaneus]|uniref:esterase B1-like n=1 Tax=Sabethes cyaneus TaxID=53552 RepID=UPI00237DA281|nr:esterase B1-like [Sabethes cyaneus]